MRMSALRALSEESGLSGIRSVNDDIFYIDIHEIPARQYEAGHLHYDICYLFVCDCTEVDAQT